MPILIILLAFFTALLQATLVPAFEIFGSFADLIICVLLILLFFNWRRLAGIFVISAGIFLSFFSAVEISHIFLPYFIVLLIYVFLNNRRLISRPSVTYSFIIFGLADLTKAAVQLVISKNFFVSSEFFVGFLLTSVAGIVFYYFSRRLYFFLNPQILREKIKISNLQHGYFR